LKILHCYGPEPDTVVHSSLQERLPPLIDKSEHDHELLVGDPVDDWPDPGNCPVTHVSEAEPFGDLMRHFESADVAHLHSTSPSPYFRLPAHLSGSFVIDHLRTEFALPHPNRVDRVICESTLIEKKQTCPRKTVVIPTGIQISGNVSPDRDRFSPGHDPTLVSIEPEGAGPDHGAADYMPMLQQSFPELTCHVVGSEAGDVPGVQSHPRDELDEVLKKAHFFVDFREENNDREPLLNAYRHGAIPVVSGGQPVREAVNHTETGFLLNSPNKGEVIQQLKVLLERFEEDPSFWIPMAENGFQFLKDHYSRTSHLDRCREIHEEAKEVTREPILAGSDWSVRFNEVFRMIVFDNHAPSINTDEEPLPNRRERDLRSLMLAHRRSEDEPEAVLDLLDSMETKSLVDHYETCLLKASCYQLLDQLATSTEMAERAMEKEPDLPDPYFICADNALSEGDVDGALEYLKGFQSRNPGYEPVNDMVQEIAPLRQ
jgi:hypothetical protein